MTSEHLLRVHFEKNLDRNLTEEESQFISWIVEKVIQSDFAAESK